MVWKIYLHMKIWLFGGMLNFLGQFLNPLGKNTTFKWLGLFPATGAHSSNLKIDWWNFWAIDYMDPWLVGGWTNPSGNYARQNGFIFPKFWGENTKHISNHHPVINPWIFRPKNGATGFHDSSRTHWTTRCGCRARSRRPKCVVVWSL